MGKNVTLAREMGMIDIPADRVIDIEDAVDLPPGRGLHHLHGLAGRADERARR